MKIYNNIRKIWKQKFTFMLIPHNGKTIRQFKLNKLILIVTLSTFIFTSIFFITATLLLYNHNTILNAELEIKNDKINNLNIIAEQQKMEIDNLKSTSKFVIDKLNQLYALENQVRDMVGLENKNEVNTLIASRSLDTRLVDTNSVDTIMNIDDLNNEETVDIISSLIEEEKGKYDQLIKDVEKQLKFLESKPDKWPVSGRITSKFGYRRHPITGRRDFHKGIDIANNSGTDIVAAGSGVVTYSGYNGGYGRVIIISHGYGYKSVYAHNSKNMVDVGDRVDKGDIIAKLGSTGVSTGPHLHFEVHYNGEQINPLKILK